MLLNDFLENSLPSTDSMVDIDVQLPIMHMLALKCNWSRLLDRLETHAEEALIVSQNDVLVGYSNHSVSQYKNIAPIHIVSMCPTVPIQVIEAFLRSQPSPIQLLTSNNNCALHLACYTSQSLEIIQLLAQADPNTLLIQEATTLKNVFHICVENAKRLPKVIPMLVHIGDCALISRALQNKTVCGRTPLMQACASNNIIQSDFAALFQAPIHQNMRQILIQELAQHYHSRLKKVLESKPPPKHAVFNCNPSRYSHSNRDASMTGFILTSNPNDAFALSECWYKLTMVLGAENETQLLTFPVLHECILQDSDFQTMFFEMIIRVNPHFVCQVDSNGDLPLHLVARLATNTLPWRLRIEALFKRYPKGASVVNRNGELPIQLLRNVSWNHVRYLVLSSPLSLSKLRMPESLYAEIIAKIEPKWQLNFIFVILKGTPSLLLGRR